MGVCVSPSVSTVHRLPREPKRRWTHHADSRFHPRGSAAEPPPSRWVTGTMRKRVKRRKSQVAIRAVGTGSSGWAQLTGSSVRVSGLNWSCCCCACCPFRFLSETPPSPCTEAGRGPRLQAGCDPTEEAPRTGWNFLLHCHHHSHYCYLCRLFRYHSWQNTLPRSPHRGPVCLCLLEKGELSHY